MQWNEVPKRLLIRYSTVVISFGLLLAFFPDSIFTLFGCATNCYMQLVVWFIGVGPVSIGMIYLLSKPKLIQLYHIRIFSVYLLVFSIMLVSLVYWGYNIITMGLDLSNTTFR